MAGAHGIVSARNPALLIEHGGHIEMTKAWVKSWWNGQTMSNENVWTLQWPNLKSSKKNFLQMWRLRCWWMTFPKTWFPNGIRLGFSLCLQDNEPCKGKGYSNHKFRWQETDNSSCYHNDRRVPCPTVHLQRYYYPLSSQLRCLSVRVGIFGTVQITGQMRNNEKIIVCRRLFSPHLKIKTEKPSSLRNPNWH